MIVSAGPLPISESAVAWHPEPNASHPVPLQGGAGWQSNGGPRRGHFATAFPHSLEIPLPEVRGALQRVLLVGVFALWAERDVEPRGAIGASMQLSDERGIVFRKDLINGRHYSDARPEGSAPVGGDGAAVQPLGEVELYGETRRVDLLAIDVPPGVHARRLRFKDLGTPASFVLFEVLFEFDAAPVCPFSSRGGGVALAEVGSIVRLGDRAKFANALRQLVISVRAAEDLDEARSLGLTFLAMVSAALLESGAPRTLHRLQLDAARRFECLETLEEIADHAVRMATEVTADVMTRGELTGDALIDRALTLIDRNFAKDLSDAQVASQLGLSTSHFRHLFRRATRQPFRQYLVALRLEKARQMLLRDETPVSEIAESVGFTNTAHFSRAFAKRFAVSPSGMRAGRR